MATRALLIQKWSSTISNYAMQTSLLPMHTLKLIEKENRRFLWGEKDGVSRLHSIAWHHICQPKERGGLALKPLKEMNVLCLACSVWRLLSQRESLWFKCSEPNTGIFRKSTYGRCLGQLPILGGSLSNDINIWNRALLGRLGMKILQGFGLMIGSMRESCWMSALNRCPMNFFELSWLKCFAWEWSKDLLPSPYYSLPLLWRN